MKAPNYPLKNSSKKWAGDLALIRLALRFPTATIDELIKLAAAQRHQRAKRPTPVVR